MLYAFTTLAYPNLKLIEVVERVKGFGFDGVELRVADDGVHVKPSYPVPKEVKEILREVKLSDLAGYARFSSPDQEEGRRNADLLRTLISMAAELGAPGIRVYAGVFKDDAQSATSRVAKALNAAADFAEKNGVKIMIETHDDVAKLENLMLLLGKLDERIKLVYDPANMIAAGERHDEVFPKIRGRIAHVHIKDFVVKEGKRVYCRPGEGIVPIPEILRSLKGIGFTGYVSVEWEKMWHPELEDSDVILPVYLKYLRRVG
jgi:sugar phosphate isomerase/epimerase